MKEAFFSYILQHEERGRGDVIEKIFDYADIFNGVAKRFLEEELPRYFVVAVRQFTGLKDINGKEIYEGDIIQHHDHKGNPLPRAIIEWNNKNAEFSVGIGVPSETQEFHEVIGNIYENPELLKGQK